MNLLRKNLSGGVRGTLVGLFIVCLIFGLSVRVGTEQPLLQHCLAVISDHYYLLYFMLPMFLLLCFFVIEDDSEAVILRYKTYFRYFVHKWLSLVVISFIFMAVQLLAIVVSGIGLPTDGGWMIADGGAVQELLTVFSSFFASPALSFAAVTAYMFVGLCVTAMILMWIGHFLLRSSAIKIILFLYVLSTLSIKIGFLLELPITAFNHIVILHHNLTSPHRLMITAITGILLLCVILWTAKKYWHHQLTFSKRQWKGITPYYCKELINKKNVIILSAMVILMVVWKYLQGAGGISGEEWIIRLFAGHGTGSFHILSFMEMLLLNGAPIYLLAAFIEKATTGHSAFITVRLKKRRDILVGILTSALLFVLIYGIFLAAFPIIGLSVMGMTIDTGTLTLLGLSVGMRLLDIAAQALFIIGIYCLAGQITAGFIGLVIINLFCMAPIEYLPFGLSSLARIGLPQIGAEGITSPCAALILLVTNALFISWLFAAGYKRLPKN
ncbi:MAG TPA: hypothetical protein GXX75_01780 [Clostridiales bacterium]|nr:hypothetical protein [Clostridiales bacterium]